MEEAVCVHVCVYMSCDSGGGSMCTCVCLNVYMSCDSGGGSVCTCVCA